MTACIGSDTRRRMEIETFACVWDALADTPAEAANLCLRSTLLAGIGKRVNAWNVPQGAAAARLGVTRPRLNDLLRGKLDKFSLDALVNLAPAAGLAIEVKLTVIPETADSSHHSA